MKKNNSKQGSLKILAVIFVVAMIASLAMSLYSCEEKAADTNDDLQYDAEYGTGAKSFTLEITDNNNVKKTYKVNTDETTVGDALIKTELIPAEAKDSGIFDTLNGIKADYAADQSYWEFFVDGESSMEGVFAVTIDTSKVYSFKYTTFVDEGAGDTSETVEETT